ncbi:uncharacterized protein LOC133863104 [Alnus glutinosa]|uniref:uncharacterized protein LOC133863104 n=1 Tax=Alnus glutinosa TaxID=3517 RepID=UPI002D7A2F9B|nr:uncharacterized protein LOC133863104 [Alnus glutinosa]
MLNAAKTSIFFSKNTQAEFKDFLRSSAGISITSSYEKYLGLPALVGRSKYKTFARIEGRVRKKMDGWKEKFLSQAGKAIPTYSMSVFQLPKKLCNSLNSLVSRFWWGKNYESKREAGQICNLVLSPLGSADQIVWQGTKHGLFSVKSAYHLEMQHRKQSRGESSKTGLVERIWKTLWNLNVPPVVKHFAWKVIHKVKAIIEDFDGASAKMEKERRLSGPGRVRWQKPPVGIMKINWDAALHKENKHMGVGVVICDDKGDVVVALSKIVPYIVDPLTAETVVVWHAARLVCEMGFQNVLMEGDSLSVIQELQKQGPNGSGCGQLIIDTKSILSSLDSVSFQHVKRDANKVAHCLAKFALSQMLDKVWVEDCPPIIQPIVLAKQAEDY